MTAALDSRSWDFIFSDYSMPRFNAFAALKLLQESGRDIPFIVISGTIEEETAVEIMRLGAHDYLMKDKLARVGGPLSVRPLISRMAVGTPVDRESSHGK